MSRIVKFQMMTLCCVLLFVSACGQVAITGRKQLNLVPDSLMNAISLQSYNEFLSKSRLSSNARQTEMVKRVGGRIHGAVQQYCSENNLSDRIQGYQWEFNLVKDESINAWAMPGGKVVVHTGLIPVAESEAGLAVVIAHEIAHVIARHGRSSLVSG